MRLLQIPNLFIAGSQKCGTTSLAKYLGRHPDCLLADPVEPMFFSLASNLDQPELLQRCFVEASPSTGEPKYLIDGSTSYMVDPLAPQRIRDFVDSDVRFVFILRNPVERAVSAYWHLAKRWIEDRELADVLATEGVDLELFAETERLRLDEAVLAGTANIELFESKYDDPRWPFRYVSNGNYVRDVSRYIEMFGRDRVHVVLLEQIKQTPEPILEEICEFLGISYGALVGEEFPRSNVTVLKNRSLLSKLIRYVSRTQIATFGRRRVSWFDKLCQDATGYGPPPTPREITSQLSQTYSNANHQLSDMLGVDVMKFWAFGDL